MLIVGKTGNATASWEMTLAIGGIPLRQPNASEALIIGDELGGGQSQATRMAIPPHASRRETQ